VPCYSPLKGWRDAETGAWKAKAAGCEDEMEVACGQCLGCRLDRARMWAMRIVHEASLHEFDHGNCFVTLTYRDVIEADAKQRAEGFHIPADWSLHKKHFKDFMKRLRKRFPQKIRYFMCGEYGAKCRHGIELDRIQCPVCHVGRPHYHAVIFNCTFTDLEKYTQRDGVARYTSPLLESIWKYGFVDVGELTYDSAAYVARYCLKKVTGVQADTHYFDAENGDFKTPEYCTMSRGGNVKGSKGLGAEWYEKYKDDLFPADEVPVPGKGVIKGMPRYYEELFKEEDPLTLEEIKERRQEFLREHAQEFTPERLMAKYKCQKARLDLFTERTI
jgi:hypothetical protein